MSRASLGPSVSSSHISCKSNSSRGTTNCNKVHSIRLRQYPLYYKTAPPSVLSSHFNQETFEKSQNYGRDKAKFSLFAGLFKQSLDSLLLHVGVYTWAWSMAGNALAKFGYDSEYEVSSFTTGGVYSPTNEHRFSNQSYSRPFSSLCPRFLPYLCRFIAPSFSRKSTDSTKLPLACSLRICSKVGE